MSTVTGVTPVISPGHTRDSWCDSTFVQLSHQLGRGHRPVHGNKRNEAAPNKRFHRQPGP